MRCAARSYVRPLAGNGKSFQVPLRVERYRSKLSKEHMNLGPQMRLEKYLPRLEFEYITERPGIRWWQGKKRTQGQKVRIPTSVLIGIEYEALGLS